MDPEAAYPRRLRALRGAIVGGVHALGPARRTLARLIGTAWYASRPVAARARTARNHRRLNPRLSERAARRLAARSFREYVVMIADSVWADSLSSAGVAARVRVVGRANLAIDERGGILAVAHFGSWDMAASAALALGVRMTSVMAPFLTPTVTAMIEMSRHRKGLELYTPQRAARGLLRALRRGRFVALMVDVPEAGPTVTVPYCGGPVRFSAVPARLAVATGAPLVPVACWRAGDHWVLEIHPHVHAAAGEDDTALMTRVAAVLEPHVRDHPEQWYPFHEVYSDRGPAA